MLSNRARGGGGGTASEPVVNKESRENVNGTGKYGGKVKYSHFHDIVEGIEEYAKGAYLMTYLTLDKPGTRRFCGSQQASMVYFKDCMEERAGG